MKQKSHRGLQDAELLLEELKTTADPSASAGLVNEEDTLEILFYQSGHMKRLFKNFPEILLIDATYNVNGVGMPLNCTMDLDMVELCIMLKKIVYISKKSCSHSRKKTRHGLQLVSLWWTKTSQNGRY